MQRTKKASEAALGDYAAQTGSRSADPEPGEGDAVPEQCLEQLSLSSIRNNQTNCGFDHPVADLSEYLSPERCTTAKDIL